LVFSDLVKKKKALENPELDSKNIVIPAKAGIYTNDNRKFNV